MNGADRDDAAENDEQDEEEVDEQKSSCERIVFLIDGRKEMFQTNSRREIQLFDCLKVVLEVIKAKIVEEGFSSLGVTFFGTRDRDSPEASDGVYTLLPLGPPSAARILRLQSLLEDVGEFERVIGSQGAEKKGCPLKQALWTCSQSFAVKDMKKSDCKRIWLFTNDDCPNTGFPVEQHATLTVAQDCSQAGVEISLWHLNSGAQVFDPNKYYWQLLAVSCVDIDDGNDSTVESRMLSAGFDGFGSMLKAVRRKAIRKRRIGSTLFSLDPRPHSLSLGDSIPEVHMAVQLYTTVRVAKKPLPIWLDAATNEPLKATTRYVRESTGEVLSPEQISTYVDVAGSKVDISKEELDALKFAGNVPGVGLKLVAFIPAHRLPLDVNLSCPFLVYPHEKAVKGSAFLFEALLRACAARRVVPLVRFNRVEKSTARLCVLWPQLERIDPSSGDQEAPPAFHLVPLPFADDIRYCPLAEQGKVPVPEAVQAAANDLVQALADSTPRGFRYDADVDNPALRQFYSVLQAVALNSSDLEWNLELDNNMRPSEETLGVCAPFARALRQEVGLSEFESTEPRNPLKRARERDSVDDVFRYQPEDLRDWAQTGQLMGLTVMQLKDICKARGLSVSGKKEDLIVRISADVM